MERVLSTYRYVHHPLSPALLAQIAEAGISSIEVFCAPGHFNYAAPEAVRDFRRLLEEHHLRMHSLHAPTERGSSSRPDSGVPISISDTERVRRLDAVDEIKRALEVAERIPFRYLVQHLGHGRQSADARRFDAAFNSLEHLAIFAKARGVTIAIENTPDELGAPRALQRFLAETHLHDLRLCFDFGHAHLEGGVAASFETMRERVATTHIHDNHGEKDEHLLPFEGTIEWDTAFAALANPPEPLPLVLELKEQAPPVPALDQVCRTFDRLEKGVEAARPRAAKS